MSQQADLSLCLSFGAHHLRNNNLERAQHIFEICIKKDDRDFRGGMHFILFLLLSTLLGYFNLGKVFSQQNKIQEAISCFEKAIELNPTLPESYGALSSCCIRALVPESAVSWSQKVVIKSSMMTVTLL
jgi:tetratricopeptide (TPR) repeat protein